jgi:hypothetical protein
VALLERSRSLYRALGVLALLLVGGGLAWALLRQQGARPGLPEVRVPEPTGITVEVLNGSNRPGLARVVTRQLRERGFDVLFFGTARDLVARTEVLLRRGDSSAAYEVAKALGIEPVRVALDTLLRLDVTVLLGPDYPLKPGK